MYEMVYRQFVGILGVSQEEINAQKEVFENTLGLVRGRVYYNLLSWYKMLAMVPGYSINADFMEKMMGVKETFDLENHQQMKKGRAWYRTVKMLFNMIRMQWKLPRERELFIQQFDKVMEGYHTMDFNQMSVKSLVGEYIKFEKDTLLRWKAPLINDFFAMIWFGLLEKSSKKYFPEETNIHNDLLCGSQDIISVEPIYESIAIANRIKKDQDANQMFRNSSEKEIWNSLDQEKFAEIKKSI